MAEGALARLPMSPWQPAQRRKASLGVTIAAVVLVLMAVAALFVGGTMAETFFLVLLVLLVLVAVFQVLVVVTGLKQAPLAAGAGDAGAAPGAWEQAYAPPQPPPEAIPAGGEVLTLKCSSCGTVFDVTDTGERPLRHVCPGCGAEGELTEADLGPAPGAAPPAAAAPEEVAAPEPAFDQAPAITLKCGNCGTVFDVTDTGERPLRHVCPGCSSEGELREEDLGPAPEPEPAAPARRAPARRPAAVAGGAKQKVKTLKLRCKNCSTVFTLRDTGERPLYHECPGCKATGVLR